jgi:bifunctional ADP-heptose synthase (sugar kinase/adenylyltransferase)
MNNKFKYILDKNLKKKIGFIKKKYTYSRFLKIYKSIKKKKILVIGDPIIDIYRYGNAVGTSSKSPSIAFLENYVERYKGGSIAVAEMLSNLGFNVDLLIFKKKNTNLNISSKINVITPFEASSFPIIERFVDNSRNMVKLLQVYNLNKIKITNQQEKAFIKKIQTIKSDFTLVIDFGFGLMTNEIIKKIDENIINYSLNCHLNSLNYISNYYDEYLNFNYLALNKREFEFSFREGKNFEEKIKIAKEKLNKNFAITLGEKGSIFIDKIHRCSFPAINKDIIDPVGCGDAFFSLSSLFNHFHGDPFLTNFVGNVYAGLHGNIVCNKEFYSEKYFLEVIKNILNK